MDITISDKDLPGLYQAADLASKNAQNKYFLSILTYIILLIFAASFAYYSDAHPSAIARIISAILFFASLSIMILLRIYKPDDIWYNGRAVAESVKTRSWRWMMRAEPYEDCQDIEIMRREFIKDLRSILEQNKSLIGKLGIAAVMNEPISEIMRRIRGFSISERIEIYRKERITNQALWYTNKANINIKKSRLWFFVTIIIHSIAMLFLLYNIHTPSTNLPIGAIAVAASGVITWVQSKKFNELSSSYSLTTHEIMLIKSETSRITTEKELSEYVMNCENAFSREHTQWVARKNI